jgi:L-fuconolactonase
MIDTHVHFWNFDPIRDSWITDDMAVIQRDFLPNDVKKIFDPLNITGCIAVQASQTEAENEFLINLAQQNPIIKGIVGWVDLKSHKLEERLSYWKQFPIIKGWRHVLQAEVDDFFLDEQFIAGLKSLKDYNYSYDLLCYHNQLDAIISLVDQVPDQAFVLDHCGKPNIKSGEINDWAAKLKVLSQNPNVSCKISGLLTEADWHNFTQQQIFECLDVAFDCFGTDRILYGSDWPVVNLSKPYADWFSLVSKYCSRFSDVERGQIFSGNARRFYQLA